MVGVSVAVAACAIGGCAHQKPPAGGPADMPAAAIDGADAATLLALPPRTRPARDMAGDLATATVSNGRALPDSDTENDVPSSAATDLSDAQILEVVHVVNRGEIEESQLAASKGRDAQIKRLAALVVRQQAESESEAAALAGAVGIRPARSATSLSLEERERAVVSALEAQDGVDFDRAYLRGQITERQAVLDVLEQKLLPGARNVDLKAYLSEVQARVATDLQQAHALLGEIDFKSRTSAIGGM